MTRYLRGFLILLVLGGAVAQGACALGSLRPSRDDHGGLVARLLAVTPSHLDRVLSRHRNELTADFISRMLTLSVDIARQGRYQKAVSVARLADYVDFFTRGKRRFNGYSELYLGEFLSARKQVLAASSLAQRMKKAHPNCFAGWLLEGMVCLRQRDPNAIEQLTKAVALRPDSAEAHMALGTALFQAHDTKGAREEFTTVLQLTPHNKQAEVIISMIDQQARAYITKNPVALAHYRQADQWFRARHFRAAIREYRVAAHEDPRFSRPYVYIGDSWLELGYVGRAIAYYKDAIHIDPTDGQPYRFLGYVYEKMYTTLGKVKYLHRAIGYYARAVKVDPTYLLAREDLKRARVRLRARTSGRTHGSCPPKFRASSSPVHSSAPSASATSASAPDSGSTPVSTPAHPPHAGAHAVHAGAHPSHAAAHAVHAAGAHAVHAGAHAVHAAAPSVHAASQSARIPTLPTLPSSSQALSCGAKSMNAPVSLPPTPAP